MMTNELPKLKIQEDGDTEVGLPNIYNKHMANKMLDGLKTSKNGEELARKYRKLKIRFIIDSAATINTIADLKNFTSYKPCKTIVKWGNANNLTSQYKGEITIKLNTGYIYTLRNVLYLPELGVNLMSLDKMPEITSLFTKNKAYLYKDQRIVAIGYKSNSLYYTEALPLSRDTESIQIAQKLTDLGPKEEKHETSIKSRANTIEIITQWHIRLGHMNMKALKHVLNAKNITITQQDINNFLANKCKTCLLAKDNRHINKISTNPIKYDILDRIHTDLGGPLPPTYDKHTYYITFLDKKSRYLWVSLIATKNGAYKAFEDFKAIVENNKEKRKIRELFSDNGGEYINKQFENSLTKNGIIHRTTPAYTKEPNGLIERINLTLFNKVRSFLIQSNTPHYLWGEALLHACYIYNRTPHTSLGYITPYESYYGAKPNIDNIRIWGSKAYYHKNDYITKLSPRKEEAIIIGYSDYNHYKLWDFNKRTSLWSRDVTIAENQFIKPIKEIQPARNNTISLDIGNNPISNPISNTIQPYKAIEYNPNHKIEIRIPNKDHLYYTIKDTTIGNLLGSIEKTAINNTINDFILTTSNLDEPNTYNQAINSLEKDEWLRACAEEVSELESQNTYTIIDTPANITPIRGRWVFKKKPISDPNSIKPTYITNKNKTIRYKARWVIQGFNQKLGIDFLETFSTTCRTETWHLLLVIAVNKGWVVLQYDVKNAFVHADIDADIYTILPIGVYNNEKKCCLLKKALYSLKQSPRL